MVLKIVIVAVALIAVAIGIVLALAAVKPNTFQITRSIVISATPGKVYGLIGDFHQWPLWAPQDREDATMQRTFSGAESGLGAISEWKSNGSAGAGKTEISEAEAPTHLTVQTYFDKPLKAHNVNEFNLEPDGSGTMVTWSMHGPNLFVMKVMATLTDMDKLMGNHFESGLRNLKVLAESR